MEESDLLLLKSLANFGFQIPNSIDMLAKIQTDEIVSISIQFMAKMGMQSYEVSAIKSLKASKTRISTKVQQELLKYGLRIDIQSLLSPNINETRKIIVSFLSKLSSAQEEDQSKQNKKVLSYEERVLEEKNEWESKIMKEFVNQQWINPSLLNFAPNEQRNLKLHIMNILDQEPLISQLANKGVRTHLFPSLASTMSYLEEKKKIGSDNKNQENWVGQESLQSKIQIIKKMRRNNDPDAFLEQFKEQFEEDGEKSDWQQLQTGNRAFKKAVRLMKEEDQEEEMQRKEKEEQNQNLFALEIQYQQDVVEETQQLQSNEGGDKNIVNQMETDLKEMRKQMREELDKMISELQVKEKKMEKYLNKRAKLEENSQKLYEEVLTLKELNIQEQKEMENQHLVLTQLEQGSNFKDSENEIKKMEEENDAIKQEWFQQKIELEEEIEAFRQKTTEKRERVQQWKEKLQRLEEQNQTIRNEGRSNLEKKEALLEEYQNMPKDVNRTTYIKKISELRGNLEKQKKESEKTQKEIKDLQDSIDFQNNTIERFYIEIENLFQQDPKKKETVHQNIKKSYQDYRDVYSRSIQLIREIGDRKIEVWEVELKTDILLSKGYKQNVEKLRNDLTEIKNENKKLEQQQKR